MNRIELTVSIREVIIQYTYNIYSRELLPSFLDNHLLVFVAWPKCYQSTFLLSCIQKL